MGIHSHRQPKYISECFFKNKHCEPSIVGIYKKLKWIEIDIPIAWKQCQTKVLCDKSVLKTLKLIKYCKKNLKTI
jgi:hypothetical protein